MTAAVLAAACLAWFAPPAPTVPPEPVPPAETVPPGAAAWPPSPPVWTVPVAHTGGVLLGMRLALSVIWTEAYDPFPLERSGRQFGQAYTAWPEWRSDRGPFESDGDPWPINVIGHGLFGSEVHSRVRQCGGSFWQAVAITTASSVAWEYAVESFTKRPSAIDLMITPVLGGVLGEARYQAMRWLRQRPRSGWRRAGEVLVDPFGEMERRWLGTRC